MIATPLLFRLVLLPRGGHDYKAEDNRGNSVFQP